MPAIPVVDLSLLDGTTADRERLARTVDRACREVGFFCLTGHGIEPVRLAVLDALARRFFALPDEDKAEIAMTRGGRAWRGWFPLGGEITSGRPDQKSGLYFGAELSADHPRVRAGVPLHGQNLFPSVLPELREAVLGWMAAMTALGHRVMRVIASALGLPETWFERRLTADPTVLFRIFHYPAGAPAGTWGVGEHTDYGLLTILAQDDRGGLQVRSRDEWIDVPPDPELFVCNLGDMLDRMTLGRYRSTPHRVRNTADRDRLSFPFFFDPGWDATVDPIPFPGAPPDDDADRRWDGTSLRSLTGTYGDYLLGKVSKVFPDLAAEI